MSISRFSFAFVSTLVRKESGMVLGVDKEYLVDSRLAPLALAAGARDVDTYVADLARSGPPCDLQAVVEALTINETSWFRDAESFAVLRRTVLPELAARSTRPVRIWTAGCSSGQEPYSIAITALETPRLAGRRVEITGTDLSTQMLARAKAAEYSQFEVERGLSPVTRARYLERVDAGWRVNPRVAASVRFQPLNLIHPFPAIGRFDIVFIRNVLIYFDLPTRVDVLRRVREVLAPDGYLVLGTAETPIGTGERWQRLSEGRSSIYQWSPPPVDAPLLPRAATSAWSRTLS